MKIHKLGYVLLGIGSFMVVFALVSDSVGLGKKGIQAAQLLLIQCGILLFAFSIGIRNLPDSELRVPNLINQITTWTLSIPASIWTLLGFLITFIMFFIFPVFLILTTELII